jgi:hypothetical protein
VDDARQPAPQYYEITVQGKIDESWIQWLDGLSIARRQARDGRPLVVLSGPIIDQAALRGLLSQLWDLNLSVIGLRRIAPPDETEREAS